MIDPPDPELRLPPPRRRLRLGMVGGGRGAFIGEVHAMGARISNRYELVAGCLSARPEIARASGRDWLLPEDRIYSDYRAMAAAESARPDGIEVVAITTPNSTHHAIACAFLARGVDVICDKPLTTSLADARDLVARVRASGLVFGVTHAFAAYPLVRQAREMVAAGVLGRLRQIHVEYFQEHHSRDQTAGGARQPWRLDPARSGPVLTVGDIGTHAHHLACFVSGLEMVRLRAELHRCGAPKQLEDSAFMQVRFAGAAGEVPGTLIVTQAAPGNHCGLRLRLYGERGGLEWQQETPEMLQLSLLGQPHQTITRGFGAGIGPAAARFTRTPRGHPEGWPEAWANLYAELAVAIEARRDGRALAPGLLAYPTVEDGARGVSFIEAALASDRADGAWADCTLAP
jgi:predicted dehydrogenase